ncbi:hypothetical protein, partial [Agathobacter rectalis]|uniref:hypothetical protein n=1 Tax=Agathobacter rectalis TaxID=39491 RepID=UPI0027D2A7FB
FLVKPAKFKSRWNLLLHWNLLFQVSFKTILFCPKQTLINLLQSVELFCAYYKTRAGSSNLALPAQSLS